MQTNCIVRVAVTVAPRNRCITDAGSRRVKPPPVERMRRGDGPSVVDTQPTSVGARSRHIRVPVAAGRIWRGLKNRRRSPGRASRTRLALNTVLSLTFCLLRLQRAVAVPDRTPPVERAAACACVETKRKTQDNSWRWITRLVCR